MARTKPILKNSNTVNILLLSAVAITLYINPNMADPFNAPKMYVLLLFSSWLIGYLLFDFRSQLSGYKN